jgi:TRAP-type C4-dicarboxylate transport system permease small subunit
MSRALQVLMRVGEGLGALAIGAITLVVVYDVAARALGYPTLWALEVSGYLMIAASVLAAGEVMQKGGHFEVRLFVDMLSPAAQAIIYRAVAIVTAAFSIAIAFGCVQLVQQTYAFGFRSPTLLQVPLVVPQSVLCIGLGLLSLAAVLRAIRQWQGRL